MMFVRHYLIVMLYYNAYRMISTRYQFIMQKASQVIIPYSVIVFAVGPILFILTPMCESFGTPLTYYFLHHASHVVCISFTYY